MDIGVYGYDGKESEEGKKSGYKSHGGSDVHNTEPFVAAHWTRGNDLEACWGRSEALLPEKPFQLEMRDWD